MQVLLLGDITGKSRVGIRMLTHVLEEAGHDVLALPTALVSNMLNLGRDEKLDTTEYLLRTLDTWEKLNIQYERAYIGYVTGRRQAEILCGLADRMREKGISVMVDPILGDGGTMYRSITQEQAQGMKMLTAHADIITPNLTEACLLADLAYAPENGMQALLKLAETGKQVVITSAKDEQGHDAVLCWDGQQAFSVPFDRVPGEHWGTGDRFCALLMDALSAGRTLEEAVQAASAGVARVLCEKNR